MSKTPEEIAAEEAATKAAEEAAKTTETEEDEKLREGGLKALKAERARAEAAEKRLAEFEKAEKEKADAEKTELEKLAEANADATSKLSAAEKRLVRLEIALAKGLTQAQMKRLVGDTQEELEADAEELLELLGESKTVESKGRPKDLRGGGKPGDGTSLEMDPDKLAAAILKKRQ